MSKKPVLYMHITSPPCRAVLLTAAAIGLELEHKIINYFNAEQKSSEYMKVSDNFHLFVRSQLMLPTHSDTFQRLKCPFLMLSDIFACFSLLCSVFFSPKRTDLITSKMFFQTLKFVSNFLFKIKKKTN